MGQDLLAKGLETLLARSLPGGGFANRAQGGFCPVATAWAVLALEAWGHKDPALPSSRDRLAGVQLADGRVCLPGHEEVFWPTPLAVLAWQPSPAHREPLARAVRFLLDITGRHWPRSPDNPAGHDTGLKGWPWTRDAHSWTEPTALAVMALKVTGFSEHERVKEAERMLMDRQLPKGGWNYGNTLVFGQELRPLPESTGLALNALAGSVSREMVERSLLYLKFGIAALKTPRSLAWSLMGLAAWGERPEQAAAYISACLAREGRYGGYDSASLAQLLLSHMAKQGVPSIFRNAPEHV